MHGVYPKKTFEKYPDQKENAHFLREAGIIAVFIPEQSGRRPFKRSKSFFTAVRAEFSVY